MKNLSTPNTTNTATLLLSFKTKIEAKAASFIKKHHSLLDIPRCLLTSNRLGFRSCVELLSTSHMWQSVDDAVRIAKVVEQRIQTSDFHSVFTSLSGRVGFYLPYVLFLLPRLFDLQPSLTAEFCAECYPFIMPSNVLGSLGLAPLSTLKQMKEKNEKMEERKKVKGRDLKKEKLFMNYSLSLLRRHNRSVSDRLFVHSLFAIAVLFQVNSRVVNDNTRTVNDNARTMNDNTRTMNDNTRTMNDNTRTMNDNFRTVNENPPPHFDHFEYHNVLLKPIIDSATPLTPHTHIILPHTPNSSPTQFSHLRFEYDPKLLLSLCRNAGYTYGMVVLNQILYGGGNPKVADVMITSGDWNSLISYLSLPSSPLSLWRHVMQNVEKMVMGEGVNRGERERAIVGDRMPCDPRVVLCDQIGFGVFNCFTVEMGLSLLFEYSNIVKYSSSRLYTFIASLAQTHNSQDAVVRKILEKVFISFFFFILHFIFCFFIYFYLFYFFCFYLLLFLFIIFFIYYFFYLLFFLFIVFLFIVLF
jgi:hypothetical protein